MRRLTPLVALVLLASMAGCSRSAPKASSELSVFVTDDATDDQRDAIDQRLRGMPDIRDVSFEAKEQAWEEFRQKFKDSPDLIAQTRPDSLPGSFRATVTDSAYVEAIGTVLVGTAGVEQIAVSPPATKKLPATEGIIVQVTDDVTSDQRADIEKVIHSTPRATSIRFESGEAAYARLRKLCRDEPSLAGALDPDAVPASYRFVIPTKEIADQPLIHLSTLAGVADDLTVPASAL